MGTLFCVKPENNYLLKLFYETFLLISHAGVIYFIIQNEHLAIWNKKDHKVTYSSFQMSNSRIFLSIDSLSPMSADE